MLDIKELMEEYRVKIVVFGIGDFGNCVINRMRKKDVCETNFVGITTEDSLLELCQTPISIQIGKTITEEQKREVEAILKDVDMVFITCDVKDQNSTQIAQVLAKYSKKQDILTIGAVPCEYPLYVNQTKQNIIHEMENVKACMDTLMVISIQDTSEKIEEWVGQGIQTIISSMNEQGLVNLDFCDIEILMKDRGFAYMGIGSAKGVDMGIRAGKELFVYAPLFRANISNIKYCMFDIVGDFSLIETEDVINCVSENAREDIGIVTSVRYEESMKDEIRIVCIATGSESLCYEHAMYW